MKTLILATLLAMGITLDCAHASPSMPAFSTCSAKVETKPYTMPPLKFADARARQYRTVIRDAAKGAVDFAGHFILATWGCGSGCIMAAAIDTKTGRVTSLPFSVSDWPLDVTEPLSYRADSCLLVVKGSRNEGDEHGTYYYVFDGKAFRLRVSEPAAAH